MKKDRLKVFVHLGGCMLSSFIIMIATVIAFNVITIFHTNDVVVVNTKIKEAEQTFITTVESSLNFDRNKMERVLKR